RRRRADVAGGILTALRAGWASRTAALVAATAAAIALLPPGCSLGNVSQDDCTSDGACAVAFGLGSTCGDGFCSAPATCARNVDCRDAVGGAVVCEDARCRAATVDPRCSISEPEGLLAELSGEGATGPRLLIGALFEQGSGNQVART